jgi:hypothetical protein
MTCQVALPLFLQKNREMTILLREMTLTIMFHEGKSKTCYGCGKSL